MMLENIIHDYVCDLAEEAQAQIQTDVADIRAVEYPCTEDDYVKLAVEATLMEDPIKSLSAILEAHSWVMTRERVKGRGREFIKMFLNNPNEEILENAENMWEEEELLTHILQNKKFVEMIIGDSNGN